MNKKLSLMLFVMVLLASFIYALGTPSFIDNSNDDFAAGTLHLTNISGSGISANVTLNITDYSLMIYNTTGNFTSQIFDTNSSFSRFDRIKWIVAYSNSSDVMGYAMDNGANDIGVFYRNGSIGTDTAQTDLNSNIAFTSSLIEYAVPAGTSKNDIAGFAWDDDGSATLFAFFRNGSVASDTSQDGLTADAAFTALSTFTIPNNFNASSIIGFAVDTDNSDSAVFFKNGSFASAGSEQPPFTFSTVLSYTLPSGFSAEDAAGIAYDSGSNDIAMFFRNGSIVSDTSQTDLTSSIAFSSAFTATYYSDANLTIYTNVTLFTRTSNDSTAFTAWSSAYAVSNGSEIIADSIARYIQYKAVLTTPDKYMTPYIENVTINYTLIDSLKPRINSSINNSAATKNDIVNISANVTDNISLSACQFITNQTGAKQFFNISLSGRSGQCSQNFTIAVSRGSVINFTVIVNDTSNNVNQSEQSLTVANFIPTPTIIFPSSDLKTNLQPLALNVTFEGDRDNDVINISYYINGRLNQTSFTNTTLNASDGVYILNVSLFDNVTSSSYSANVTVNFTIDTAKPNITLNSPASLYNTSSQNITFNFTVTDNLANELNCSIYIDSVLNSTNSSALNGTATLFQISGINEGSYKWNITCLDGALNSNASQARNFTVDLKPPVIQMRSFSPNSTDDVDQNVLLNFTINVTDNTSVTDNVSAVKIVVLQYRQSGAGLFTNSTARYDASDGFYYANFTPNIADTWSYKIYAEDYAGNNDTSAIANISVQSDRTWTRTPSTFNNLACGFSKTCTGGNLTINNTGDFTLNFDLSSNFGDTSLNVTEPFDLIAKEVRVVEVNLTAGSTAAESNIVITTDATTSNADPDIETTNFTFTASAGGPVFEIIIISPPLELNRSKGDAIHLNASLRNIGNETAGQTWINWTLPANWLNISGTNLTKNISNLSVQEVVFHNITINLTSSASTGTQKINISAASNNSAADSASASVVVTETSTTTTTTTTTSSSSGGSGSGSGGGGGGGGSAVEIPAKPEEIEISQKVELLIGRENSFYINVTNTFSDAILDNLTLQVDGFLSQYITIEPKVIRDLRYLQDKSFRVTVSAPSYKDYEEHTLKATVTGMLIKTFLIQGQETNTTAVSRNSFTLKNYISLIIQEISKEEAGFGLEEAAKTIEEMQNAGFPVSSSLNVLEDARKKVNAGRYKLASEAAGQIAAIKKNAFSADSLISDVKTKIQDAEKRGLQAEETKSLLNLALAAFEREDFLTAIQRAKDAQLSIIIETKGKINIAKFIIDYWWPLLTALLALSAFGYFMRKKLVLVLLSRKIGELQNEEVTINGLLRELQEKYYTQKKISTTEYHKLMYSYEKRLGEISQLISRLRSKRVGIIEISNEIKNLENEDTSILLLTKQLQDAYFNRKTVTKNAYMKKLSEYKLRRAEIEKSVSFLEAKLAKKEKLDELKIKGTPKKEVPNSWKKEAPLKSRIRESMELQNASQMADDAVKTKSKAVEPPQKSKKTTVLSILKDKFNIGIESPEMPKSHTKSGSDAAALEEHGFKVIKEPENKVSAAGNSKHNILKYLREVHKHG